VVAGSVSLSLFLSTPGIPFYQAFAAQFTGKAPAARAGAPVSGPGAAGFSGVSAVGSVNTSIGTMAPGLEGGRLPTLDGVVLPGAQAEATAVAPEAQVSFSRPISQYGAPSAEFRGRASRAIVERAAKSDAPQNGLWGTIVHRVKGGSKENAPAASQFIAPKAETLSNAGASKDWGARSFDALRGLKVAETGAAAAVEAPVSAKRRNLLAPAKAPAAVNAADEAPPAPKSPLAAFKKQMTPWKIASMIASGATSIVGMYVFGLSIWYAGGAALGVSLAFTAAEKIYNSRKEKRERKARSEELRKPVKSESVLPEAEAADAAEAASQLEGLMEAGEELTISLREADEPGAVRVPLNKALVERVRKGELLLIRDELGIPSLAAPEALERAGRDVEVEESGIEAQGAQAADAQYEYDPGREAAHLAQLRASGQLQAVKLYDAANDRVYDAALEDDLLVKVQQGELRVATDSDGTVYLVTPEVLEASQKQAEEAAKAQADMEAARAETAKDEAEAVSEEADQSAEPAEALENEPAEEAAAPVVAAPKTRSPNGVYGAVAGSIGAALTLSFQANPIFALIVPVVAYAAASSFKGGKAFENEAATHGAAIGLAAGVLAAAGILTLAPAALPISAVMMLPALGAVIAFAVEGRLQNRAYARAKAAAEAAAPVEAEAEAAVENDVETPVENDVEAPVENDAEAPVENEVEAPVENEAETVVEAESEAAVEETVEPQAAPVSTARQGNNPSGKAGNKPASFKKLPENSKGMNAEGLLEGKAAALARARKYAADARLVRVAFNLDDPRGNWSYVFHSRQRNKLIIVYPKRVAVRKDTANLRKVGKGSKTEMRKAEGLWNSRLKRTISFEEAYTQLKQGAHWFKPFRVELVSKWGKDPVYAFIDARGRVREVKAVETQAVSQSPKGAVADRAPPTQSSAPPPTPRSFRKLPAEARGMDAAWILEAKKAAQARARAVAPDARLVRAAINLSDPNGHWSFIFHSRQRKKLVIVWPKRLAVRKDKAALRWPVGYGSKTALRTADGLWNTRLGRVRSLESAYTALKREAHWFKPIRVEIVSKWKKNPVFAFIDAQGRVLEVPGVEKEVEKPKKETPKKERQPAPPADKDVEAPSEPQQPPADPPKDGDEARAPPGEGDQAKAPPAETPPGDADASQGSRSTKDGPHLHEDLFGFRTVRGRRHGENPGRLPANADAGRIIQQIAAQFNMTSAQVLAMASKHQINELSGREAWLAVYDRLQDANRQEFAQLDQQKYHGGLLSEAFGHFFHKIGLKKKKPKTASYRELAGKTYAPGWKGWLHRAAEMHKHVVGFTIRFPYHLFDMFFFGYFRRNISFEFFHSTEDFITLRDELELKKAKEDDKLTPEMEMRRPRAERMLDAALKTVSLRGVTKKEKFRANTTVRFLTRYLWNPLVSPLGQFLYRRATLAIFSAVAMGLVGGLLPLPVMAFHLSGVPILGEGIMMLGHGIPTVAANVPFIGDSLAAISSHAINALLGDLTVGALVNTLALSSLLTFPQAVRHRLMELRGDNLYVPPVMSFDFMKGALKTLVTWTFWSRNLKSFGGLLLVGAEIEGIMTYMGEVDGAINPAFESVTGQKFELFHTIGAAIERPEGDSPIPFGGAITWGNILIYKLQDAIGFNISDAIAKPLREIFYQGEGPDAVRDALRQSSRDAMRDNGLSVTASVIGVASAGALAEELKVEPGTPEEMAKRAEDAKRSVGDIEREIAQVKQRIADLERKIGGGEDRLRELEKESKPISDEERARYEDALQRLSAKRDEGYVRSKLAQIYDIKNADEATQRVQALADLQAYYESLLPKDPENAGYRDSIGVKLAVFKMVQEALVEFRSGPQPAPAPKKVGVMDQERAKKIGPLVDELEKLRAQAKGELANRDAIERLLRAVEKTRKLALQERRGGQEMLEFHKNLARLATVMDLAFSLNTIEEAQKAIKQMEKMLDDKLDKIERQRERSEEDLRRAREQEARREEWERENADKIKDHETSKKDMLELEDQTRKAVANIQAFRSDVKALLARIDAEDKGSSPNALAEYERRLELLPTLKKWAEEGNPNDPDANSMKSLRETLNDVEELLESINDGLADIDGAPVEFAGVLVLAVPGEPEFNVTNPDRATTLRLLAERKEHWQKELVDYQEKLTEFTNRLDPTFSGTETDDFGDVHPVSLPKRLAEARETERVNKAEALSLTAKIDAAASKIRAVVPGADLPNLSGMTLEQLQDAVSDYADKIKAIELPTDDSTEAFDAKMAMFEIAALLPQAGNAVIKWSKADAEIETIEEALQSPVPQVKDLYTKAVAAVQGIIDDVDADIAYVNAGAPTLEQNQRLIDRKKALLLSLKPTLLEAKQIIANDVLPFQQDTVDSYDPDGDKWAKLFTNQKKLYEKTRDALDKTIPWALASNGASDGDKAGALSNIADQHKRFRELLDGYDDEDGHHTGVLESLADIAELKDPNNTETEEVYGQVLPVSLPRLIAQMEAEHGQRADEINLQHRDINDIFIEIDRLTDNRYNLSGQHSLPTGIVPGSQGSIDSVQRLVDDKVYQNLGDMLTDIGTHHQELGEGLSDSSETEGVPSGVQPRPDVDNDTRVALLALEAAKRLVPSTNQAPEETAAAYAVARFLYSDAAKAAAEKNLYERIPYAENFLNQAKAGLENAISDLDKDKAYVNSDQTSETSDQVLDRKIAIFSELNQLTRAGAEFYGLRVDWARESYETIEDMETYYSATGDIHDKSGTVVDKEVDAIHTMKDSLKETFDELEEQRQELVRWMNQLNRPEESALKRVAEDLRKIQEKTKRVLEENVKFRELEGRFAKSEDALEHTLGKIDDAQKKLARELRELRDPRALSPEMRQRIDALRMSGNSWYMPGSTADATSTLVIPKKDFTQFVDTLFSSLLNRTSSARDLAGLRESLLNNPAGLANVIPGSKVIDFGDADGFYLVYQSQFSVPNGLETSSSVTLGNVAKIWGNNISVSGYVFASPPNEQNAPWGDKGVKVQIESLQGKNWVNYLDIDFHRFVQNIPKDTRMASTAQQSRLLVFEDFAMLLFGDRVYIAATGFGDIAVNDPHNQPKFYGGSLKTSLKFTEVVFLDAEHQVIKADDPRFFEQVFNLDFTGLDDDLNRDFVIRSDAENKSYSRTQVGPRLDLSKVIKSQDAFEVEMFWARQRGTDDYNQDSYGVNVLKGFTIRDKEGKPWAVITNKAGYEKGDKFDTLSDRVSVNLPNWGVVVSAEGRLIGDAKTYYLEAAKKTGANTSASIGYGSKYVGQEPRLTISMNTTFTLGELWSAVAGKTAEELTGSKALEPYNTKMDEFYKDAENDRRVKEMKSVFMRDVGAKLVTQDIGKLVSEIQQLRKAGAFADNTRVRATVGFVTNPVGDSLADRAVGGGFTAGTYTSLELSKTQKELIDSKMQSIYRESLRLQFRMLELTKQWQETVTEIAQAQWDVKMAAYMKENAPTESLRLEGASKLREAELRLKQAAIRYNMLSGRDPSDALPFGELKASDLDALLKEIRSLIQTPDKLQKVLHELDPAVVKASMGDNPFNIMDWVPWIEQITVSFGAQLSDYMANQVLGIGTSFRLPVYDPASDDREKAYTLESEATIREILQVYEEYSLESQKRFLEAKAWTAGAETLRAEAQASAARLAEAIKGYRNGLIPESRLREAFAQWHWYMQGLLEAEAKASLTAGWSRLDASFGRPTRETGPAPRLGSFQEAFDAVARSAYSLEEVAMRRQAAAHMTEANNHRIQKFYVDLFIGYNLTADGVGWLPSIGITGIPVTPVLTFELKPTELKELQVKQGEGKTKYYEQFKAKLEADLAVDFFNGLVSYTQARDAAVLLEGEILPELRRAVGDARADSKPGDPEGLVAKAQKELDAAERKLQLSIQVRDQARAALNHLLGRDPKGPLDPAMDPDRALSDLKQILADKRPSAVDREVLVSRVEIARAVETMVDKGLKIEKLRLEPVSLAVRSLSRLLSVIGDEHIGNPDLVAAARIQTLEAERALESYDRDLPVRRAQIDAQLAAVNAALKELSDRSDAQSRLKVVELRGQKMAFEAALARLDAEPRRSREPSSMPASYNELFQRLAAAEQRLASAGKNPEVRVFEPETATNRSEMNVRYFKARQDLGGDPIGENYIESWITFRLKNMNTPPEVLLALSQLREAKAERVHRNEQAAARSRAQILLSQFETNVRLLRWNDALDHAGTVHVEQDRFEREIHARLLVQTGRIKALLNLPAETSLQDLMRLVPADPAGDSGDLRAIAGRFVKDVNRLQIEQLRRTLFEGGVPASFGNEDGLMQQIRADVIAERMSYKGFTPTIAFGFFRATPVNGVFMEAPDPRSIERSLQNVLSDSVRKELQSQGRMHELALRLHLLMSSVSGRSKIVEAQSLRVIEAERDYRAAAARHPAGHREVSSAQDAMVRARLELTDTVAKLKNDFIELVSELEAVGYDTDKLLRVPARDLALDTPSSALNPVDAIVEFASRRSIEPEFVDGFLALGFGTPEQRAALKLLADEYRDMDYNAMVVRHHPGVSAKERLELLTKADVEGRRLLVENAYRSILADAFRSKDARGEVFGYLLNDVKASAKEVRGISERERAMFKSIGEELVADLPHGARGAFSRLSTLDAEMSRARQTLLEDYLANKRGPTEFVMRDRALDAYLQAVQKYDAEVVKVFERAEIRDDARSARVLNSLFPLREALARQKALASHGRGMLALDALIEMQNARLAAAEWERAAPGVKRDITLALTQLTDLRDRWHAKNPDGLIPLYAVTQLDAAGRRTWTVDDWLTGGDVQILIDSKRAEIDGEGRIWLLPDAQNKAKREIVGGVDAALSKRDFLTEARDYNNERADLHKVFQENEFAAVSLDGRRAEGIAYRDAMALAAQGKAFNFARTKDGYGLHAAQHPLKALWDDPSGTVTILYRGDKEYSRDRFPTLESLQDHIRRLEAEGDAEEAAKFVRLETGPKGVAKMIEFAREFRSRSATMGWTAVKLQTYGFAADPEGTPEETFLTKKEFDAFHDALNESQVNYAKNRAEAIRAKALEQAAGEHRAAEKTKLDAELARFNAVERSVRDRLQEGVQAANPRREGEGDKAYAHRLKGLLDEAVVDDREYKNAQSRHAEVLEAFNKVDENYKDRDRGADKALRAFKASALIAAKAGHGPRYAADFAKTLEHLGVKGDDLEIAVEEYAKTESRRLFVTRDAALHIDATNRLVRVSADPVFGSKALDNKIREANGAVRIAKGELFGAVVDRDGAFARLYYDPKAMDAEAKGWSIRDVHENGAGKVVYQNGGRTIDPNFRLKHYIAPIPNGVGADGNPETVDLPVMLNRRYLISRLADAGQELSRNEAWAYGPWNWGNILMEIPRGVLGTPTELLTGRDANQHNYLGRANMTKIEGGATIHHNFFRRALGALDILDLMPDPVDWYFDPSQFPDRVTLDSELKPGQNIYDRDARSGRKDVHFGRTSIERTIVYNTEDLLNANRRVQSYFEGGLRDSMIEKRSGRAVDPETGLAKRYYTSTVKERVGLAELEKALKDRAIGFDNGSYLPDGEVRLAELPRHLAVDMVERRVMIRPGAEQYESMARELGRLPELLEAQRAAIEARRDGLEEAASNAERRLADLIRELVEQRADLERDWDEAHRLIWRIGKQEALEREMAEIREDLKRWRAELERLKERLAELEEELRREREREGENPTDPERPGERYPWWPWVPVLIGLWALIAAIWEWLRRRRGPRIVGLPA
jgi:hypothetical protein